jgi:hypothetical protein
MKMEAEGVESVRTSETGETDEGKKAGARKGKGNV